MFLAMFSCAPPPTLRWTRTIDHFNSSAGIYYNESIPLKLTVPKDWKVNVHPENISHFSRLEKAEMVEIALYAEDASRLGALAIALEKGPAARGLTPIDYVKVIKDLHKKKFEETKYEELILIEEELNGLPTANWQYKMTGKTAGKEVPLQYREAVLLHNDYAVRVRCCTLPSLYEKYKPTFAEILGSVSIE